VEKGVVERKERLSHNLTFIFTFSSYFEILVYGRPPR
jgi:hypothetical protein